MLGLAKNVHVEFLISLWIFAFTALYLFSSFTNAAVEVSYGHFHQAVLGGVFRNLLSCVGQYGTPDRSTFTRMWRIIRRQYAPSPQDNFIKAMQDKRAHYLFLFLLFLNARPMFRESAGLVCFLHFTLSPQSFLSSWILRQCTKSPHTSVIS